MRTDRVAVVAQRRGAALALVLDVPEPLVAGLAERAASRGRGGALGDVEDLGETLLRLARRQMIRAGLPGRCQRAGSAPRAASSGRTASRAPARSALMRPAASRHSTNHPHEPATPGPEGCPVGRIPDVEGTRLGTRAQPRPAGSGSAEPWAGEDSNLRLTDYEWPLCSVFCSGACFLKPVASRSAGPIRRVANT
jgi:hypothetical protein